MLSKRWLTFLSIALLLVTLPVQPASADELDNGQSINVWLASPELTPVLRQLASDFTALNPSIRINAVNLPNEDLKTSIIKAVYNNNAPEIAIFSSDNTIYAHHMRLSGFDTLAPLNIDKAVLSSLEVKQRFYGQPLQQNNRLVLLYNKSLVAAPASSWEQIIEQTPFLLQQGILPAGVLFNEPYWFAHFATLFEPSFTEDQQPSLSTVPMQQALRFYQHLADMRAIDSDCSYDCVSVDFYAGKVAYSFAGVWALEQAKQALGKNLGITDLPTYQGRPMHALASTVLMVYPNDSWNGRNQEVVRKFSRYLQSSAAQLTLAKATSIQPIRQLPQHETQSIPMLSAQSNLSGPVILMPANSAYVSIWNGMRKGLRLYQSGALSETEAAAFMQRVAMRDLQSMERLQ